jgi:hypothetical protein
MFRIKSAIFLIMWSDLKSNFVRKICQKDFFKIGNFCDRRMILQRVGHVLDQTWEKLSYPKKLKGKNQ